MTEKDKIIAWYKKSYYYEKRKKYLAENPEYLERQREYTRKWQQENKEYIRDTATAKRRAMWIGPRHRKCDVTPEEWEARRMRKKEYNRLYKIRKKINPTTPW